MSEERLKPCPFCGSKDVGYEYEHDDYISCRVCNCYGPDFNSVKWNDRSTIINSWNPITETPEYDREVIIEYENGAHELFNFWGTSWPELVTAIAQNCSIHTGYPIRWAYVPEGE